MTGYGPPTAGSKRPVWKLSQCKTGMLFIPPSQAWWLTNLPPAPVIPVTCHAYSVTTTLPSFFRDWVSFPSAFSTAHHGYSTTVTVRMSILRTQLCISLGEGSGGRRFWGYGRGPFCVTLGRVPTALCPLLFYSDRADLIVMP